MTIPYTKNPFLTKEEIIKLIKDKGSPTEGVVAFEFWILLNQKTTPIETAVEIYEACGYIPFQGYPLKRKSK